MNDSHPDLAHEFPEYKETIHTLKMNNAHFAKLYDKYVELNHRITKAESRLELLSEQEEESLRRERMHIKDELYATMQKTQSASK